MQSGNEASIVAKITEAEAKDTVAIQTLRDPPVLTIKKTAVYAAAYALTYIRVKLNRNLDALLVPENGVAQCLRL